MSPGATRPLTTIFEFPENSAGHNRKKVCATLGYPYSDKIKAIDGVLNRDDAIDWIINHQANRHNLTPEALSSLRAKHYKQERKKHGAPKENVNAKKQSAQSGHFVEDQSKTQEKVAKKYGVGKSTIARDVQYDDGLDKIAEACGDDVKRLCRCFYGIITVFLSKTTQRSPRVELVDSTTLNRSFRGGLEPAFTDVVNSVLVVGWGRHSNA